MTAVLVIGAIFLYFFPSLMGGSTQKAAGIFVLNLFLGWTLVGWVVALVWAVSAPKKEQNQTYTGNEPGNRQNYGYTHSQGGTDEFSQKFAKIQEIERLYKNKEITREQYEQEKRNLLG